MNTFFRDYSLPLFLLFTVLYLAKSIFAPLVIAIFLVIIIQSSYRFFLKHVKNTWASWLLSFFSFSIFLSLVIYILTTEVQKFIVDIPLYKSALQTIIGLVEQYSGWRIQASYVDIFSSIDFSGIAVSLTSSVSNVASYIFTIVFFVLFILLELPYIRIKLHKVFWGNKHLDLPKVISHINEEISYYFLIKFFIALLNGIISFSILSAFWVRYALFFSFVVFLLDFIPNIGWFIAMILPFLFCFIQFPESLSYPFIVLLFLLAQQTIMGNFVEPKIMWQRLNLSTLAILLFLMFWWSLWWVVGAFLAVPIMTILSIILSHFESTKSISIFLSEKGQVK